MFLIIKTNNAPITADIGSTKADACPKIKLFVFELPELLRGRDTAAPSGKFWIPIPRANIIAPINVILPVAIPPNATPIAIPSGILWIVIADNNNAFLFLLPLIILSKKLSDNKTNKPPITKPILGNNHSFSLVHYTN